MQRQFPKRELPEITSVSWHDKTPGHSVHCSSNSILITDCSAMTWAWKNMCKLNFPVHLSANP